MKAKEIIGWILIGQMFTGMYLMVTNYIFYSKETKLLSFVTIFSGVLNVILLYMLIPVFGLKGAAFAFCISMFVRFILTWIIAAKKVDMPWLNKISEDHRVSYGNNRVLVEVTFFISRGKPEHVKA